MNLHGTFVLAYCLLLLAVTGTVQVLAASPDVLTNAAQIRGLSPAEAEGQLPIKLRATVTAFNPSSIFLQDSTGGTFININPLPSGIAVGNILEISGVTFAGRYIPGVRSAQIRVIGQGELPSAVPVNFDDLLSARKHYERIEIDGIVRSVVPKPEISRYVLKVAVGRQQLEVQLTTHIFTNLSPLIDSEVRIVGLAAGYINNRRQLTTPQLLVNRIEDVRIVVPPPVNALDLPITSARDLLNFNPAGVSNHRVRVRGVVTHWEPGEAIFVRDGEQGFMVQTVQENTLTPGDIVEAVGFPAMGQFSALLEDADFRIVGRGSEPRPILTTVAAVLTGTNDVNLISIDAELIEVLHNPTASVLVLRAENTTFQARVPRSEQALHNGSRLRVVGVCRLGEPSFTGAHFGATPRIIELLARSPADVTVLSSPSEWTAKRLALVACVLLGLTLAALVWAATLRQRVAAQAKVISEKVQREAALEERHRMAREMHDTLAQSFSGLGFQLDALHIRLPTEAEAARSHLETARQMVRHGQEDFRRSLMNLRAQELERGGLTDVLPELARQITIGGDIIMSCDIQRPARRLPEAVETNLLRISQESLVNAVRHAHPKHLELSLRPIPGAIQLRIADDGIGFDTGKLIQNENCHFGLRGIQERAEQIHAKLDLKSHPGSGTVITVTVPLKS